MGDITKPRLSPDYENYTKGVAADVAKKNQQNIVYAKRVAKGDSDFSVKYDPDAAAKKARQDAIEWNKSAEGYRKEASKDVANRSRTASGASDIPSYKHGGKVKRTGLARVHRGERVLTKSQNRRYSKGKA